MKDKSNLQNVLDKGLFAVTAEVGPPKGSDPDKIIKKAEVLKGYVDAFNILRLMKHGQDAVSICYVKLVLDDFGDPIGFVISGKLLNFNTKMFEKLYQRTLFKINSTMRTNLHATQTLNTIFSVNYKPAFIIRDAFQRTCVDTIIAFFTTFIINKRMGGQLSFQKTH